MKAKGVKLDPVTVFWFRRDLRLHDNTALCEALRAGGPVLPVFVFDTDILDRLEDRDDRRVDFIHRAIADLKGELERLGSAFYVAHGRPLDVFRELATEFELRAIYANRDYEPEALKRDNEISEWISARGGSFHSFKDQVIFEGLDIAKDDGSPYSVYTPYARRWRAMLTPRNLRTQELNSLSSELYRRRGNQKLFNRLPALSEIGFQETDGQFPPREIDIKIIKAYARQRDFPAINGTSRIGVHLRFGTVSIRDVVKTAKKYSDVWLGELIWREFFMQVLANHPRVVEAPFKPEFAKIKWRDSSEDFERWCRGETGVGMVDAGMRELNVTGFMHNRVRMIAASFLVKHLLINWRWGERYFARKLLDFDLAANNGNWQWVAGTGCDAAPYFRVFNPALQAKKFDPESEYVRRWVPEIDQPGYEPMVDFTTARVRALKAYAAVRLVGDRRGMSARRARRGMK
jgi:deoxyribodipyrimidine photo-lyase